MKPKDPDHLKKKLEPQYVDLGPALNHLLNRRISLHKTEFGMGGLDLPMPGQRNGGKMSVILVTGQPGSGKSTLALQMVTRAAALGFDSLYLSLEDHPDTIRDKAKYFGKAHGNAPEKKVTVNGQDLELSWENFTYIPQELSTMAGNSSTAEERVNYLLEKAREKVTQVKDSILEQKISDHLFHRDKNGNLINPGAVVIASLLPRPVDFSPRRTREFFLQQYEYLETLIKASSVNARKHLGTPGDVHRGIRIVVVDSLNMLCHSGQSRESIYRVFDLFRANGIMGIFTGDGHSPVPFDSTMADVVLNFSSNTDSAYLVHYLSVEKSRYTATAYGLHPFKITGQEGIYVLPSLHAVVADTQNPSGDKNEEEQRLARKKAKAQELEDAANHQSRFPFGWGMELTKYAVRSTLRRKSCVVALHGPLGTHKSTIAVNFLIHGLTGYSNEYLQNYKLKEADLPKESGILIRLKDAGEGDNFTKLHSYPEMNLDLQQRLELCENLDEPLSRMASRYEPSNKVAIKIWGVDGKTDGAVMVVIDFNTGMLLAEEFVDILRNVQDALTQSKKEVSRVAIDDVSVIGTGSYPLLEKSITTANLFLPAFVHLMRNQKVDLMMVGTRGNLESGNRIVDQAIALADTAVETRIKDIFGDRYILIFGEGEMAERPSRDWVPPTLRIVKGKDNHSHMKFDPDLLQGLVGFDSSTIKHTRVFAYLYEENKEIHRRYNETLPYLLEPLCGLPSSKVAPDSGLQVISFRPEMSDTVHHGVDLMNLTETEGGATPPKQHTVLAMIDEFEPDREWTKEAKPYTNNALIVAWREGLIKPKFKDSNPVRPWETWQELLEIVETADIKSDNLKAKFWVDRAARESLSCCLADCLFSGWKAGKGKWIDQAEAWEDILKTLKEASPRAESRVIESIIKEAKAMHDLLYLARESDAWTVQASPWADQENEDKDEKLKNGLPDDAAVYICWYAQLRHLLARNMDLAGKFRVAALPGGGFTGDWRLVVLPGSVSHRLGHKVVEALVSPEEDYRRFSLGVGLPVGFDGKGENWQGSKFRAWPGAHEDVSMQKVYQIHQDALKRSLIKDYIKITPSLATFAKRLAGDWQKEKMTEPEVKGYLIRLPAHFEVLQKGRPVKK